MQYFTYTIGFIVDYCSVVAYSILHMLYVIAKIKDSKTYVSSGHYHIRCA
jgi:hypothetical protein